MSVFQRQLIKGSAANILGMLLGVVNNFWLLPLVLSLDELGVYRWIERTSVLIASIVLFGLHRTYVRYQSKFSPAVASQFLSNVVVIIALIAAISGVLITVYADLVARLFDVESTDELAVLGVLVAGSIVYTLGLSISSSAKRITIPYFVKNVGVRIVLMVGAVALWGSWMHFPSWMQLFAWTNLVVGVAVLAYSVKIKGLPLVAPRSMKMGLTRELAIFSGSSIMMTVMTMSLTTIDSQMVASLLSYEALGVYGLAFFLGSFVDGIRRPVSQLLSPQFAVHWNDSNIAAIGALYSRTSRILMAISLVAFLTIVPNIDFIFSLIHDAERFEAAKTVVTLILISRIVDFSFGSNGEILSNGPYFKWTLVAISILVIALIGLNSLLIPQMGLDGAGYSLIIAYTVFNVVKAWFLYNKEGIQPFSMDQFYMLGLAAVTFILSVQFAGDSVVDLLFRNLIIVIGLGSGFFAFRKKF
jgi:O-antigen/teichoic acid export membrane protein